MHEALSSRIVLSIINILFKHERMTPELARLNAIVRRANYGTR